MHVCVSVCVCVCVHSVLTLRPVCVSVCVCLCVSEQVSIVHPQGQQEGLEVAMS